MSKLFIADKETLDAVLGKVNTLANTFADHIAAWTGARAAAIDTISTNTAANHVANATGILSQKLSYIIEKLNGDIAKYKHSKSAFFSGTDGATTQRLNIQGAGELLYIALSDVPVTCTIVLDGVTSTQELGAYATYGLGFQSTSSALLIGYSSNEVEKIVHPICFSKSCDITLTSQSGKNVVAWVQYNIYE